MFSIISFSIFLVLASFLKIVSFLCFHTVYAVYVAASFNNIDFQLLLFPFLHNHFSSSSHSTGSCLTRIHASTFFQINFKVSHPKKRCCMLSSWTQKQQEMSTSIPYLWSLSRVASLKWKSIHITNYTQGLARLLTKRFFHPTPWPSSANDLYNLFMLNLSWCNNWSQTELLCNLVLTCTMQFITQEYFGLHAILISSSFLI